MKADRSNEKSFHLPTIPYSPIDAVNRMAAATGSIGYAMAASSADYNGHSITVSFNDYQGYWVVEYTWAGRNVLYRGELAGAIAAALEYYRRGAKGSSVRAMSRTPEDERLYLDAGFVAGRLPDREVFWTPEHDRMMDGYRNEQWRRRFGSPVNIEAVPS